MTFTMTDNAGKVSQWCTDNHMAANTTETQVMLITTWQKRASLLENMRTLHVRINGQYRKKIGLLINY